MVAKWIYLHNTFVSATSQSFKKALIIFEDTIAKLKAESVNDAGVLDMYNDFYPYYEAYKELYQQKVSQLGSYESRTMRFENILAELPQQLRVWEGKVRAEYPEDSPEEHEIFPNKRTPFISGAYELRISSIKSLMTTLDNYPLLSNVKTLVETYFNRLESARLAQQEHEGQADKLSVMLEAQRLVTCRELYGTLARLMYKYRHNPDLVLGFFDLSLIKNGNVSNGIATLRGKVLDKNGLPIIGAIVRFPEAGYEATTDINGAFMIEAEAGNYLMEIVATGYPLHIEEEVILTKDQILDKTIVLS